MNGVLLPIPTMTFRNRPFGPARTPADFTKGEQHADPDETLVLKDGEDELCLVVNRQLSNKRERLLAALGISVIWHDGLRFSTSHGASKTWLTKIAGAR